MERDNPDSFRRLATNPSGSGSLRDRAMGIIAFATVLALLYLGRDVLIPFTAALILSLLIAPLVRRLRRVGLGQTPSVLVAVFGAALLVAAAAGVLGTQVLHMAESLPLYERTIQQKLHNVDEMTVGRLNALTSWPVGYSTATRRASNLLTILDPATSLRARPHHFPSSCVNRAPHPRR